MEETTLALWAFIVSILALAVSMAAVYYTRRQAKAADEANRINEAALQLQRADRRAQDLERVDADLGHLRRLRARLFLVPGFKQCYESVSYQPSSSGLPGLLADLRKVAEEFAMPGASNLQTELHNRVLELESAIRNRQKTRQDAIHVILRDVIAEIEGRIRVIEGGASV